MCFGETEASSIFSCVLTMTGTLLLLSDLQAMTDTK